MIRLFFAVVCALNVSGCATVFSENTYPVAVKSIPREANFRIINRDGDMVHQGITPETVQLESGAGFFKKEKYKIEVWKEDHTSITSHLHANVDPWWFGNFIFNLGIGAFLVDSVTGSMWEITDNSHTILHQINTPAPPTESITTPQAINITLPQVNTIPAHTHTQQQIIQAIPQGNRRITTTTIPVERTTTTHTTNQVQTVEEVKEPLGPAIQTIQCSKEEQPCP